MSTTPTPFMKMEEGGLPPPPPPPPPMHYKNNKHAAGSCCRCICCFCIFLLLLILTLSLLAFYFYTLNKPRLPSYALHDLRITAFSSQPDSTIQTNFLATIKADNPNANIGFIYGEDNSVNVVYNGTDVCSGKLPHFQQGPRNVTMMKVDLVGKSEFGSGLQEAYMQNSKVALLVKVKVPVRIVVGEYALREVKVFVNCSLVVDNLALNDNMNIVSNNMTFDYQF